MRDFRERLSLGGKIFVADCPERASLLAQLGVCNSEIRERGVVRNENEGPIFSSYAVLEKEIKHGF